MDDDHRVVGLKLHTGPHSRYQLNLLHVKKTHNNFEPVNVRANFHIVSRQSKFFKFLQY